LLLWSLWPGLAAVVSSTGTDASFFEQTWYNRQADVLLQIVIVFSGVVGVLNLLADVQTRSAVGNEPAQEAAR
jgi:hypothetical protein